MILSIILPGMFGTVCPAKKTHKFFHSQLDETMFPQKSSYKIQSTNLWAIIFMNAT